MRKVRRGASCQRDERGWKDWKGWKYAGELMSEVRRSSFHFRGLGGGLQLPCKIALALATWVASSTKIRWTPRNGVSGRGGGDFLAPSTVPYEKIGGGGARWEGGTRSFRLARQIHFAVWGGKLDPSVDSRRDKAYCSTRSEVGGGAARAGGLAHVSGYFVRYHVSRQPIMVHAFYLSRRRSLVPAWAGLVVVLATMRETRAERVFPPLVVAHIGQLIFRGGNAPCRRHTRGMRRGEVSEQAAPRKRQCSGQLAVLRIARHLSPLGMRKIPRRRAGCLVGPVLPLG